LSGMEAASNGPGRTARKPCPDEIAAAAGIKVVGFAGRWVNVSLPVFDSLIDHRDTCLTKGGFVFALFGYC
jgi:hypothetical protein